MERTAAGRRERRKGLTFLSVRHLREWLTCSPRGKELIEEIECLRLMAEPVTKVEVLVTHLLGGRVGLDFWGPRWLAECFDFVEIPEMRTPEGHALACELADVKSERSMTMRHLTAHTIKHVSPLEWIDNYNAKLDAQALAAAVRYMKGISR